MSTESKVTITGQSRSSGRSHKRAKHRNGAKRQDSSCHAFVVEELDAFSELFFLPTMQLLCKLLNHDVPSVRIYAYFNLTEFMISNMPAFNCEELANIAFQLKTHRESETDSEARSFVSDCFETYMDAVMDYGKECRAARLREIQRLTEDSLHEA